MMAVMDMRPYLTTSTAATPAMPNRVQVGPYSVRVIRDQAIIDRSRVEDASTSRMAVYNRWRLTITMTPELAEGLARQVLLHEVIHACYHAAGLADDKLTEEEVACCVTPVLLETLRRNPALVAYLTAED